MEDAAIDWPALHAIWWEEPAPSMHCYHNGRGFAGANNETSQRDPCMAQPETRRKALAPRPGVRCLDANHASGCARCTLPPADEDTAAYVLRGEHGAPASRAALPDENSHEPTHNLCAGAKNGEKMLRGQLCRTHQWRDAATREDAAVSAERARMPELAVSLRLRNIAGACVRACSGARACVRACVFRRTCCSRAGAHLALPHCLAPTWTQRCASATSSSCATCGAFAAMCGSGTCRAVQRSPPPPPPPPPPLPLMVGASTPTCATRWWSARWRRAVS